jgi:stage II sporulation protein P
MLVVGTDDSGLAHPDWRENLKLALRLQAAMNENCPTLARPISLRESRFNQQATTGSLILEVGTNGNTLQEALSAVELFADSISGLLLSLVK